MKKCEKNAFFLEIHLFFKENAPNSESISLRWGQYQALVLNGA